MGRGKVQMKLIEKLSVRKSVYKKRLCGLKKKAYEISKLCDVPAMVISVDSDGKVETFPENKEEVCAILRKYDLISNKVARKYKQNSESMIQSHILKKQLELNQLRMDNENMVNAAVKSLDSMLARVEGIILLKSYMQDFMNEDLSYLLEPPDFVLESSVDGNVDVGKLNGEKECEEEEVETAVEKSAHCHELVDLPDLFEDEEFSFVELLKGNDYPVEDFSVDDMNDVQMAMGESAYCHEHDENLQIVTHLATEESDQFDVFGGDCNEFSEHISNPTSYVYDDDNDDLPYLFELADFVQF